MASYRALSGLVGLIAVALAVFAGLSTTSGRNLAEVEAEVARKNPGVAQLSAGDLEAMFVQGRDPVILDVREAAEFQVSHIAGAARVEPGTPAHMLVQQLGDRLRGREVVVYCSVGVRSSELAQNVQQDLMAAGATTVYNLAGGIFRWHNDQRRLVNGAGSTPYVHPYDSEWGRLVSRSALVRTQP